MNAKIPSRLPPDFIRRLEALAANYLRALDPLGQSGFSAGAQRWRAERSPILNAIATSGTVLDVGCANGYLLECLVRWGAERGLELTPFGVDYSAGLIALARKRWPQIAEHFFVADAWGWTPARQFQYVYAVFDCVPPISLRAFVQHLLTEAVAPGGRLILGAYGNRSRAEVPEHIGTLLEGLGFTVVGASSGGLPEMARFAWIDK
jgi:SAM-dependent methyltransferase